MKKYYNENGDVAVLVSYGYGAGWSTWISAPGAVFNPRIVKAILDKVDNLEKIAEAEYPEEYVGGVDGLSVEWVPEGAAFRINEYDGAESLEIYSPEHYYIA